MEYALLKDVSRQSFRWKILVRLARLWEFRDQQTNTILYELDFVVVDRQGTIMEGLIPGNRIDQFRSQLKEGSIYAMEQFVLSDAKRSYKSTEHPYRIRFTQRTKIKEVLPQPENFPVFAYNAQPFSLLQERIDNNTLLSDVVGLVTAVTEVTPSVTGHSSRRQIYTTNGSQRAVVTLWGDLAELFDATALHKASMKESIVVLFVGMTVSHFVGMLAFKSTSVTRWYINIPIPEMTGVRQSIKDHPCQIEWQGCTKPRTEPTETTITAIAAESPYDIIGNRFRLKVLITSLITTDNWWYLACKGCWKKTYPNGNVYKCPRCTNIEGESRYRITVHGIDVDAQEASNPNIGQFTFFGPEGVAVTGKDEILLVSDARGRTDYIPPEIANLVGQKYVLVAELSSSSLDADYPCLQVHSSERINEAIQYIKSNQQSQLPSEIDEKSTFLTSEESEMTPSRDTLSPFPHTKDNETDKQKGKRKHSMQAEKEPKKRVPENSTTQTTSRELFPPNYISPDA